MIAVVGRFELDVHEVDCPHAGRQEEKLHGGVIHRDEVREQIQVTSNKNQREQNLGAT